MLTKEEMRFMQSQGIAPDDVFDTKGRSPKAVKVEAKAAGKRLLLGAPCQAAGHRLRTRAGHCVQCDPSKIAYQRRTEVPGDVDTDRYRRTCVRRRPPGYIRREVINPRPY